MSVVGITGGFGTGKTVVTKFFRQLGASTIDADKIAHRLLRVNTPVYKRIVRSFKKKILKKASLDIDRKKLARVVFSRKNFVKKLNRITHPQIIREIKKEIVCRKADNPSKTIVIDAPLLIEAGALNLVDRLVVVSANKDIQISRLKKYKGLSETEIQSIIKTQLPISEKIKSADYVVDNSGSLTYTKKQVKEIWDDLKVIKRR